MSEPTEDEMNAVRDKVLDLLFTNLTKRELLALHELWDSDPGDGMFYKFTDRLVELAPEAFSTPGEPGEGL